MTIAGQKRVLTKQTGISLRDLSLLLTKQIDLRRSFFPTCEHCGDRFQRKIRWGRQARWCQSCMGPDRKYGWGLLSNYNLSYPEFLVMKESCGNLCEICRRPPLKKELDVDHDHKTGKVRGLLCTSCNMLVGQMEKPTFKAAICGYLERR